MRQNLHRFVAPTLALLVVVLVAGSAPVNATTVHPIYTQPTDSKDQQRLDNLKKSADREITRRLTTLGTLTSQVAAMVRLNATDKAALTSQISGEITDLTALKAKIDSDTDLATARTDAAAIVTDYRVYALIVPKVHLLRTADIQLTNEDKLSTFATKLQTRIDAAKANGKNVTAIQATLNDMNTQTASARTITQSADQALRALQPGDYNSNHSVLSNIMSQLRNAHQDIEMANKDAHQIVGALQKL